MEEQVMPNGYNVIHKKMRSEICILSDYGLPAGSWIAANDIKTIWDGDKKQVITILDDLVAWGYAERKIEPITSADNQPRGEKIFYRLT